MKWTATADEINMELPLAGHITRSYNFKNDRLIMPDEDERITEFVKID